MTPRPLPALFAALICMACVARGVAAEELAVEVRAVGGALLPGARVCAGTRIDACRFARARTAESGIALLAGVAPAWTSVTAEAPGHFPVVRRLLAHDNVAPLRIVLTPVPAVPLRPPDGIKPALLELSLGRVTAGRGEMLVEAAWRASVPVEYFCVATAPHVVDFESWRDCTQVAPRDRHRARVPLRTASGNAVLVAGESYRLCLRVATWDRLVSAPVCRTVAFAGPSPRLP